MLPLVPGRAIRPPGSVVNFSSGHIQPLTLQAACDCKDPPRHALPESPGGQASTCKPANGCADGQAPVRHSSGAGGSVKGQQQGAPPRVSGAASGSGQQGSRAASSSSYRGSSRDPYVDSNAAMTAIKSSRAWTDLAAAVSQHAARPWFGPVHASAAITHMAQLALRQQQPFQVG